MVTLKDQIQQMRIVHLSLIATVFATAIFLADSHRGDYAKALREIDQVRKVVQVLNQSFAGNTIDNFPEIQRAKESFFKTRIKVNLPDNEFICYAVDDSLWAILDLKHPINSMNVATNNDKQRIRQIHFLEHPQNLQELEEVWNKLINNFSVFYVSEISEKALYKEYEQDTLNETRKAFTKDWEETSAQHVSPSSQSRSEDHAQTWSDCSYVFNRGSWEKWITLLYLPEISVKKRLLSRGAEEYGVVYLPLAPPESVIGFPPMFQSAQKIGTENPDASNLTVVYDVRVLAKLREVEAVNLLKILLRKIELENVVEINKFDISFPALKKVARNYWTEDFSGVWAVIEDIASRPQQNVEVLGTKISTSNISFVLITLIIVFQIYLYLHFCELNIREYDNHFETNVAFPWIALHHNTFSVIIFSFSAFAAAPLIIIIWGFMQTSLDSFDTLLLSLVFFLSLMISIDSNLKWLSIRKKIMMIK